MPGDEILDDSVPIFTQADVYFIGGYVAATLLGDLDPHDPRVVEAIDEAVVKALGRK